VRVFRTCRELGIATVAVVARDDRESLHARSAGEIVEIASYLEPEEHVRAARAVEADAIHPGYGFLAENGDFAAAVEAAGVTWIGPPPEALRLGGDKVAAKQVAREAGVPVLPDGSPEELGYPLLVKAALGGGGRGMRIVRAPGELEDALAAAEREAAAGFGEGRLYCERYLERPRHVEVQLLADSAGNVVALGERDCSVQRRHQKVLEESPSPAVDEALRARLVAAASAFASATGYRSAGTVEFLLDGDDFFFLELNGRIQVEHPVTELVGGVDLVAWQLRIAGGESLVTYRHKASGHAVEVRLYAEDPATFLPQAGRLDHLRLPCDDKSQGIRVDCGVEEGDEIGLAYDPLVAKIVTHGRDRTEALDRLSSALAKTEVSGITTNLAFLRWLVDHPAVREGEATTAFLTENPPLSQLPPRRPAAPWRQPWRLNLPVPPPAPPPDVYATTRFTGPTETETSVVSPMPGTVIGVEVEPGDTVRPRQPLIVLEAMKMEIPVHSPFAGTVKRVHISAGERVAGGALLVELEAES